MRKKSALLISSLSTAFLLTGCSSNASIASSSKQTPSSTPQSASVKTGDTVIFGKYQNEDIEWYVLSQKDDESLLLTVHAIDAKPFNETPATWDQSSLRTWLNGEFYQTAFSKDEQQNIVLSSLDNGDDLNYGSNFGQNTEDYVFLLSASQAQEFLSKDQIITSPTDYALSQGAYTNEAGDCAWWLRSPGMNDDGPAYYSSQGDIGTRAHKGSETIIGTRPAVWVKTDVLDQ